MVAHACNPSAWEAQTEESQICDQPQLLSEALSNLVRPCFRIKNKTELEMMVHVCNPSTWEAETGGPQIYSQPQQFSEALYNLVRPCFKIKNKK